MLQEHIDRAVKECCPYLKSSCEMRLGCFFLGAVGCSAVNAWIEEHQASQSHGMMFSQSVKVPVRGHDLLPKEWEIDEMLASIKEAT